MTPSPVSPTIEHDMRQAQRWRFYCDHCTKSGGSRQAMARHEAMCFANPNRVCEFCADDQSVQQPLATLIAVLVDDGFAALQLLANYCPACIASALRQGNTSEGPHADEYINFDYKQAVTSWAAEGRGKYHEDNRYHG